jgi:hypothetical protein
MRKTSLVVGLFGALVLASSVASADTCPVDDIGKACTPAKGGGTCISAKCTDTNGDGVTTMTACATCVDLPDNYCSEAEGKPCGDGGVCSVTGGAGSGGGSTTSPASSTVSYTISTCEPPGETGGCKGCLDSGEPLGTVDGGNGAGDDSSAVAVSDDGGGDDGGGDDGGGTAVGDDGSAAGDDASPPGAQEGGGTDAGRPKSVDAGALGTGPSESPPDPSGGGGCTMSRAADASSFGASLAAVGIVLGLRRRRRAVAR